MFHFFRKLSSDEVENFFGEVRQNFHNCLNQNFVIESFLENGFDATLSSRTVLIFENSSFQVFLLKLISLTEKARQSVQNCLNSQLAIKIF